MSTTEQVRVFPLAFAPSSYIADAPPVSRAFFVGEENKILVGVIENFPRGEKKNKIASPLVLVGGIGLGKTHLATGLWTLWSQHHPKPRALCLSGIDFVRDLQAALDSRTFDDWRKRINAASLCVIDGIEPILQREYVAQELLFLLDESALRGNRLILTMTQLPTCMSKLDERLRTRLMSGLVITLAPPKVDTRLMYLKSILPLLRYPIFPSLLPKIAEILPASLPKIYGLMLRVCTAAQEESSPLTPSNFLKRVRAERLKQRPTIALILRRVAKAFGVRQKDLKGKSRISKIAEARGIAVWLARQETEKSLQEIGEFFGKRDHKTISHLCRATELRLTADAILKHKVEGLRGE